MRKIHIFNGLSHAQHICKRVRTAEREREMMVEEAEETKNENLNCTYVSFNFHAINKNKALC